MIEESQELRVLAERIMRKADEFRYLSTHDQGVFLRAYGPWLLDDAATIARAVSCKGTGAMRAEGKPPPSREQKGFAQ